jgi:hypothetical protein
MQGQRKAVQENSRHAERVERAYPDALLLATHLIVYQPTSRDQVTELTMRRWINAIGLLRLARVYKLDNVTPPVFNGLQ